MFFLVKKGLEQLLSDWFSVNVNVSSVARRLKQANGLAQMYFTRRDAGVRGGEGPTSSLVVEKK